MRRLLVSEVEQGLKNSFDDIEELAACCKFSDCSHKSEPGCAIKAALQDGLLSEKRWKTYRDMLREEAFSKERKKIMMKKIGKARREYSNDAKYRF